MGTENDHLPRQARDTHKKTWPSMKYLLNGSKETCCVCVCVCVFAQATPGAAIQFASYDLIKGFLVS